MVYKALRTLAFVVVYMNDLGKPQTRADRIYQSLRERIVRYEFLPGERLYENVIASSYGVSRTPVRESLQRLEQIRLLARDGRNGYVVRPFDLEEMDELYEARIALEELSVRRVASRLTPRRLKRLRAVWASFPEQGDPSDALAADEMFHEALAEAGGNRVLLEFLKTVNERIHVMRRIDFTAPDRWRATRREHREIIEALASEDAEHAVELMREHILRSKAMCARLASEGLAQIYLTKRKGAADVDT